MKSSYELDQINNTDIIFQKFKMQKNIFRNDEFCKN